MSETWRDPGFTALFIIVAVVMVLTGITRVRFLAFLILTTAYFFIFRFPEVANHVNLVLFLNIAMVIALVYSFLRRGDVVTDNDVFEMISPLLRASLILVYFIAGFDKLNHDYFDPAASCGGLIFGEVISQLNMTVFGLPVALLLGIAGLFVLYRLASQTKSDAGRSRTLTLVAVCLGGATCIGLVIVLVPPSSPPGTLAPWLGLGAGVVAIAWELGGSLALAVPRLQAVVVPMSLGMHAVLAFAGFVDFGALALALLFAFVPPSYHKVLKVHANARLAGLDVHRAKIYFSINIMVALLLGIDAHVHHFSARTLAAGILFNSAVLVFVWPLISAAFSPTTRPS